MEEQRPKRKAATDAKTKIEKSANSNGDSDDPDYEDKESGSDGSDAEWVGHDEDSEDGEDDDEEGEDEDSEDSDSDIDDHSNSDKNKREVYNALARELGMNADKLRKGVTMVLHAGSNPSFLKSFYTAKDIEGEHGLIRSAVMNIDIGGHSYIGVCTYIGVCSDIGTYIGGLATISEQLQYLCSETGFYSLRCSSKR